MMIKKLIALAIAVFVLGWLSNMMYASLGTVNAQPYNSAQGSGNTELAASGAQFTPNTADRELAHPANRLNTNDVHVTDNQVIIDGVNGRSYETAVFTDTNSMDPVIDDSAQAIQIVPLSTDDINVGDIISYDSGTYGVIIHRVIYIGNDSQGWYAIVKGDNNPAEDPIKVRFSMIKRVLVAVVY